MTLDAGRSALLMALAGALLAAGSPATAGTPSLDASATIAVSELPAPRAGLRDLTAFLGKDPSGEMRSEIEAELRDLEAFRELRDADGSYRLDVRVLRSTRELTERGGVKGETPSSLEWRLESECRWTWGETGQIVLPMTVTRRIPVDGSPTRPELESLLRALVRETGERAFAALYEATDSKATRAGRADGP